MKTLIRILLGISLIWFITIGIQSAYSMQQKSYDELSPPEKENVEESYKKFSATNAEEYYNNTKLKLKYNSIPYSNLSESQNKEVYKIYGKNAERYWNEDSQSYPSAGEYYKNKYFEHQKFNIISLESIDLLKDIASEIFFREKNKPYTKIEMCTHSPRVVAEWQNYSKPSTNGINPTDWRSILQRKDLYVFNESSNDKIINNIADLMKKRENINVLQKAMGGDASKALIIEVLVLSNNTGIKYTDRDMSKMGKVFGRKKASTTGYDNVSVNNIKIFIDISSIVKEIEENGHIDSIGNLGSIKTICPAD